MAIDDSQIPLFYEEKINLTLGIEGPNSSLFNFVFDIVFQENISKHVAEFTPLEGDEGWYNISINVTDANKHSNASFNFTLNIVDRNYVVPNITYPDTVAWFSNITFFEDLTTELVFRANHSVDEDLFYEIYVGDNLRNSTFGYGNDTNVTLDFTPEFIDETYGGVVNLTLIVKNGNFLYADLQTNRSWEIKINHTNAPIEFFNNILNDTYPVGYSAKIDLRDYFLDLDHEDDYYNQTIEFDVFSNDSSVSISEINEAWELFVFSNNVLTVMLNITASDLNISNESIKVTNITSNNFEIYFEEAGNPEVIIEYLTEPDTGGDRPSSGQANIVALKIITPGGISAYEGDTIDIPLQLFNSGEVAFNDIDLNAVVLKQGDEIHEIGSSLDKDFFNILNAGQSEDMTLTLFFNTSKAGKYEVLISAESRYPKYKDWAKIHIDLEAINESKIRELLVFTEEFVAENPQCMEIIEVVEEAEEYLIDGDLVNANIKTRQALESCRDAISQVSVPDRGSRYFRISLYFILTVFIALILGLVYYFIRRRQIQKIKKPAINKDIIKQKDFNR